MRQRKTVWRRAGFLMNIVQYGAQIVWQSRISRSQWIASGRVVVGPCLLVATRWSWLRFTSVDPFESGAQLSELANKAFCDSGPTSIHLSASVPFIGESCFSDCDSLVPITFESGSQLQQSAMKLRIGPFAIKFCGKTIKARAFSPEFAEKTYYVDQNL
jgi:hypothetical protein